MNSCTIRAVSTKNRRILNIEGEGKRPQVLSLQESSRKRLSVGKLPGSHGKTPTLLSIEDHALFTVIGA